MTYYLLYRYQQWYSEILPLVFDQDVDQISLAVNSTTKPVSKEGNRFLPQAVRQRRGRGYLQKKQQLSALMFISFF